jgi:pyruvate-formate lyase-activating enzyme
VKKNISPSAALAGVPAGVQGHGIWAGRRQLFVRFAGEAETATLYTADGLASELKRLAARSSFHSVALSGRDVLGNAEYLEAVFESWKPELPVLLDSDGQRPEMIEKVRDGVTMVQVTVDFSGGDAALERGLESLSEAARLKLEHALVLLPREDTSDAQLLRAVERGSSISSGTAIVIHPHQGENGSVDRRWATLLEQTTGVYQDVRLILRIPAPAGIR